MSDSAQAPVDLFSREARAREDVLTAFEDAWLRGDSPEIEDFLAGRGEARLRLLRELVQGDLEFRSKAGEAARVETYLHRFPELGGSPEAVLDVIECEFELRRRTDPSLAAEEYAARFPHLAADVRNRLTRRASKPRAASPTGQTIVTMRVIDGPHRGLEYRCEGHETVLVGRSKQAALRLREDRHFSRFHLRIEAAPPACYLVDLDSRNGTLVNGERVKRAFLKHGDVISGGQTKIAVTFSEPPAKTVREDPAGTPTGVWTEGRELARLPAIPGYDVLAEIGSGSMGRVYRAVQQSTGTVVAVKIVIPAHSGDHDATRLFIREATLLSQLNHPGIVRLHEIGLAEGLPFLAMEYVETTSHTEILERATSEARPRIACGIVCRVLDALGHAHVQSLVHRDVKPSNILLSRTGRKLQVKLADFGLARNYMVVGLSSITRDGDLRGTIAFMPPEQILDCRYAKPTCDLYATGVTLYYYLSGRLPYEFAAGRSHFATVLNGEPTPLDRYCPELAPELIAAVHRAIARSSGERFLTADEMRGALLPFTRR